MIILVILSLFVASFLTTFLILYKKTNNSESKKEIKSYQKEKNFTKRTKNSEELEIKSTSLTDEQIEQLSSSNNKEIKKLAKKINSYPAPKTQETNNNNLEK